MIYFDNAASSPLSERSRDALAEELTLFANPSSLHRLGFEAEKRMNRARAQVASALGAASEEIVFTSGGTEADNLALFGAAKKMQRRGNRILATDSEHPAVEECLKELEKEGFEVIRLKTRGGRLDPTEIENTANEKTILAAVMHTNNETGAIYDVAAVSRIVKRKNPAALVFSDCVQGFLHAPFTPQTLGADLVSISSHKIHGPKGVGALYVKKGLVLPPRQFGGHQERALRSGTEPLPLIVAFGEAAKEGKEKREERLAAIVAVREAVIRGLAEESHVTVHQCEGAFSPHILSIAVAPYRSEVLLHKLSERDIFVSSGSACSSHSGKSPVLENFGLSREAADRTVRLSFSGYNTVQEAEIFVKELKCILK